MRHFVPLFIVALAACVDSGPPAPDLGVDSGPPAPDLGVDLGPPPACDPMDAGPGYDASWFGGATVNPDASLDGLGCSASLGGGGCAVGFGDAAVLPGCLAVSGANGWITDGARLPVVCGYDPVAGTDSAAVQFSVAVDDYPSFRCYPLDVQVEIAGAPTTHLYAQPLQSGHAAFIAGAAPLPPLDEYENVPATIVIAFEWKEQRFHVLLDDPRR